MQESTDTGISGKGIIDVDAIHYCPYKMYKRLCTNKMTLLVFSHFSGKHEMQNKNKLAYQCNFIMSMTLSSI